MELLLVMAMVALLASLLLPAMAGVRRKARGTACQSNLGQFSLGFRLYADDNEDAVLPNRDGRGHALGEAWVEGWLGEPGPDATNVAYLKRSLLGRYLPDTRIWRCPAAGTPDVGGMRQARVRTVSLNGFMGSPVDVPQARTYRKSGDITSPSETLVFVDERIDTINDGSFGLMWNFDAARPSEWVLRDKPTTDHGGGAYLTFADGHSELRIWRDMRTLNAPRDDAASPGNEDVLWMQARATLREGMARP